MPLPAPPFVLSWRGLRRHFGRQVVLRGLDLDIERGSIFGLAGLNGAGKTTALESSLGLLRGYRGEVRILGERPEHIARLAGRLGVVFDTPCLRSSLRVREVFEHARLLAGARARAPGELEERLGVARFRTLATRKLSLGNRKRLSIALALVSRPELVILDEPFSGLDAGGVDDVIALVETLHREEGTSFVLSSHQLHFVERVSSHVAILHDGLIACSGETLELLGRERPRLVIDIDPGVDADAERVRRVLGDARESLVGSSAIDAIEEAGATRLSGRAAPAEVAEVNRKLVLAGIAVRGLRLETPSLESLFRRVTSGSASSPSDGKARG